MIHDSTHAVAPGITYLFAGLLFLMVMSLAFEEKIHTKKSLITGLFSVICLPLADAFGILPLGTLVNAFGEEISLPVYITGIDWEVIAIILGSGIFVDVVSKSGLFTWIAISLTRKSKGDPLKLLCAYGILTVLFSAFLNNVTAIIIIGSLTAVSLEKLEKQKYLTAFLLVEGLLTNVGGLLTLISSVPNIIAGNIAGISFLQFFVIAAPYVLFATVGTIFLGAWYFKIPRLSTESEKAAAKDLVDSFDSTDGIESKSFFVLSSLALAGLIGLFASASFIPVVRDLGLGYIAVTFGLVMLTAYRNQVHQFYKTVDWDLIGFFIFLFIVINVMEHAGVLGLLGGGLKTLIALGETSGKILLLWGCAISSSVTDNIPLTAVVAKILSTIDAVEGPESPFWWAVIFGANLGGNITPIGSASTLVAVSIMHKHNVPISFLEFVKQAWLFALLQLVLATIYLILLF